MGGAVFPDCSLACNGDLFQKDLCQHSLWLTGLLYSVSLTPWLATVDPCLHWTLTDKSGSVSHGVTAPFSWVLVFTRFCVLQESVSPVLWKFCNQIPPAFPGGSLSLCWTPRWGDLLWALEIFQQCKNFFDLIVVLICISSSWQLYGGANGDLLIKEDLCHMLCLPGLLQPEPLPPPAGHCWPVALQETLKHSKTGLAQSLWGLWVLVCIKFCLNPPSVCSGYQVWF